MATYGIGRRRTVEQHAREKRVVVVEEEGDEGGGGQRLNGLTGLVGERLEGRPGDGFGVRTKGRSRGEDSPAQAPDALNNDNLCSSEHLRVVANGLSDAITNELDQRTECGIGRVEVKADGGGRHCKVGLL